MTIAEGGTCSSVSSTWRARDASRSLSEKPPDRSTPGSRGANGIATAMRIAQTTMTAHRRRAQKLPSR
jgi:hypothetical protein